MFLTIRLVCPNFPRCHERPVELTIEQTTTSEGGSTCNRDSASANDQIHDLTNPIYFGPAIDCQDLLPEFTVNLHELKEPFEVTCKSGSGEYVQSLRDEALLYENELRDLQGSTVPKFYGLYVGHHDECGHDVACLILSGYREDHYLRDLSRNEKQNIMDLLLKVHDRGVHQRIPGPMATIVFDTSDNQPRIVNFLKATKNVGKCALRRSAFVAHAFQTLDHDDLGCKILKDQVDEMEFWTPVLVPVDGTWINSTTKPTRDSVFEFFQLKFPDIMVGDRAIVIKEKIDASYEAYGKLWGKRKADIAEIYPNGIEWYPDGIKPTEGESIGGGEEEAELEKRGRTGHKA